MRNSAFQEPTAVGGQVQRRVIQMLIFVLLFSCIVFYAFCLYSSYFYAFIFINT